MIPFRVLTKWQGLWEQTSKTGSLRRRRRAGSRKTARTNSAPRRAAPAWRRILSQFQDPLVYLLLAAVAISLVAWVIEGGPAGRWMRSSSR